MSGPRTIPFFRPKLGAEELAEVLDTLQGGWLTTGPKARTFEDRFRTAVNARCAVALNSCTAALHLAVEALGLGPGDAVLVPTLTFAATAEVVRYMGATPVLCDCEPQHLHMDLASAARRLDELAADAPPANLPRGLRPAGAIPVHVGGVMMNVAALQAFAASRHLWLVEDAAHAFPAAWRPDAGAPWQQCGEHTAAATCFSFYANKTITTGEGGMLVTDDEAIADRARVMALHGLSADAWHRYSGQGGHDYQIIAPGYKYNLTDIAAALGIHQLARAEAMRQRREQIATEYSDGLADLDAVELPPWPVDRVHAWHLFPIRLRLDELALTRRDFIEQLARAGIGCSVHWRPLHLHPYYQEKYGWKPSDLPVATAVWERLVSLPIFSAMEDEDVAAVVSTVRVVCESSRKRVWRTAV